MQYLREEIQYLLDNDFIELSQSDWNSPCILVPKPDGTFRMCLDDRKVNIVTKTDSFPVPRMDDCIDNIGQSKICNKIRSLKRILANSTHGQSLGDFCFCNSGWNLSIQSYALWNEKLTSNSSTSN